MNGASTNTGIRLSETAWVHTQDEFRWALDARVASLIGIPPTHAGAAAVASFCAAVLTGICL
jgi:hypothetical protein